MMNWETSVGLGVCWKVGVGTSAEGSIVSCAYLCCVHMAADELIIELMELGRK